MQIDDRVFVPPFPDGDENKRSYRDRGQHHNEVRLEPVFALAFVEDNLQSTEPECYKSQADIIDSRFFELTAAEVRWILNQPRSKEDGKNPDRNIDEENPAPAEVVGDPSAERRANCGSGNHGHAVDSECHAALGWRESVGEDGLLARLQSTAASALQHAANDQNGQIW